MRNQYLNCSRDIKSLTGTLPLRFLNLVWPSLMKRTTPTSAPKLLEPSEFPSFLLPLFTTFDFWVCVCVCFFLQFFLFHNLCRSCLWVNVNRYWSFSLYCCVSTHNMVEMIPIKSLYNSNDIIHFQLYVFDIYAWYITLLKILCNMVSH